MMTELCKRFIEDMQLFGYSERTIEAYTYAVRQLARHYHLSPDKITEEQLRQYFLYNKNIKQWSASASRISLSGIKFLYTRTLNKPWPIFDLIKPGKEHKIPAVLSKKEVRSLLEHTKLPYHKALLATFYSLGLRLQEGLHLQISDIDSDRMFVHVHRGKGNKDRYIPLPISTLKILREHWLTHKNKVLLFPAPGRGSNKMPYTDKPMPKTSIQLAFKAACKSAGIIKKVSLHHLRHTYAVHLLEAGVDIRYVQEYMGHKDPKTTKGYSRMINVKLKNPIDLINKVMAEL